MSKSSFKTVAKITAATLALGFVLPTSFAQEASSSADATKLKQPTSKEGEGLDAEITNARMRAESGSKSKLSMSASLGFSGGSVKKPLSEDRPNIAGDPTVETATDLSGSVSARYRFTQNTSATFGAGVGVLKPLHGAEDLNISDPGVSLSHVRKLGVFQSASSISYTHGTSESYKDANIRSVMGVSQNMMAQIGNSNFTAGASVGISVFNYTDDALANDGRPAWRLGIYPQLEYAINDRFQARTVFGYLNYQSKRDEDTFDLNRRFEYQSVGVGMVLTRDIYLYPNVQFIPDNLALENTNVAISATINLF